MVGVAADPDSFPIHHLHQKTTGIGTVIRTYRSFDLAGQKNPPY
jgi:hypothetical protein